MEVVIGEVDPVLLSPISDLFQLAFESLLILRTIFLARSISWLLFGVTFALTRCLCGRLSILLLFDFFHCSIYWLVLKLPRAFLFLPAHELFPLIAHAAHLGRGLFCVPICASNQRSAYTYRLPQRLMLAIGKKVGLGVHKKRPPYGGLAILYGDVICAFRRIQTRDDQMAPALWRAMLYTSSSRASSSELTPSCRA
jgi:hypothetical protein